MGKRETVIQYSINVRTPPKKLEQNQNKNKFGMDLRYTGTISFSGVLKTTIFQNVRNIEPFPHFPNKLLLFCCNGGLVIPIYDFMKTLDKYSESNKYPRDEPNKSTD